MPKPVAEVAEGHEDTRGNGVYSFIRDLIVEGRDARFVNKKGRYVINWSRALKCYHDYKSRRNPQYKSKNINRRKASNGLRAALLNFYKKEGAKEYKDCKKVNEKDEVIERQFQMPPKVFESLFGSDVQLSGDSSEHETSSIASEVDEKPLVTPNSSDTGFDEYMDVSDDLFNANAEPSSHCALDGLPTGDPLCSNVKTEEDQFDPSDITTPCQIFDISEEELDSALGEICSNSDNDIDLLGVVRDICPSSGSVKGGIQFYISLMEELSEDDKSGIAHFDGIGDVYLERLNCYTFVGTIPASQQPGHVPVTVNTQDGRLLGMTVFLYVDEIQEVLKQLVNDPALQSLYFAMWSKQHGFLGSNGNIAQNLDPFTLQDQGSSIKGTHAQALKVLQLLVYTAAQTNAQQFIQMIFSTSAGRLIFNAYKDQPQLPEDVARANGHDDLAQYLQDVNTRLTKESTSDTQPNAIDWLELIEAVNKIQKQSSVMEEETDLDSGQSKDDDNQSDYFADAETSSCGSFDLEIGWCDSEDGKGPCSNNGGSNKEPDVTSTPSMKVMPCEASAEVETQSDNDNDLEDDKNYEETAFANFKATLNLSSGMFTRKWRRSRKGDEASSMQQGACAKRGTEKLENTSDRKQEERAHLKHNQRSQWRPLRGARLKNLTTAVITVLCLVAFIKLGADRQLLHWAVRNGHTQISHALMKFVWDVDVSNFCGETPLHVASRHGYKDLTKLLLKFGSNVNAKNYQHQTPLHLAAGSGFQEIADALIRHGSNLNARDDIKQTAAHLAALNGHRNVLEVLLQHGSDVNAWSKVGLTPLHLAAMNGHRNVLEVLLQHGSDVNAWSKVGLTPLHLAALNGHRNVLEVLLQHGSDVNAWSKVGLTPLHLAALNGHRNVLEVLLQHGSDVNAWSKVGSTPLYLAALNGHRNVAEVLIRYGSDVNVKNYPGQTPLHWAAESGHQEITEFLIQHGSELNVQDDLHETALHLAARNGHKNVAEVLIRYGSDVNVGNQIGHTPLHLAARTGQQEITEFLIEHGSELMAQDDLHETALHLATRYFAEVLTRYGSDVNFRSKLGETPLYVAAGTHFHLSVQSGVYNQTVEKLMQHGRDVNARDRLQLTPLHLAARNGYKNLAEVLIRYGSDVNASDISGQTPLHLDAQNGQQEILKFLIDHGSDLKAQDDFEQTPLHLAARNGLRVVEVVIRYGSDVNVSLKFGQAPVHTGRDDLQPNADVSIRNNCGQSPAENGHKHTCDVLTQHGSDVNARDIFGKTPLRLTVTNIHESLADSLRKTPNRLSGLNGHHLFRDDLGARNIPVISVAALLKLHESGMSLEDLLEEEFCQALNSGKKNSHQTSSEPLLIHWESQVCLTPVNLSIGLGDDVSGPCDYKLKMDNQSIAQCFRISLGGGDVGNPYLDQGLVITFSCKYQARCETAYGANCGLFNHPSCILRSTKFAANGRPKDNEDNEGKEAKIILWFGFVNKCITNGTNKLLIRSELPLKEVAYEGHHLVEAAQFVPLITLMICIVLCTKLYYRIARGIAFKQKFQVPYSTKTPVQRKSPRQFGKTAKPAKNGNVRERDEAPHINRKGKRPNIYNPTIQTTRVRSY